jgi:hypothetical protein
LIEWHFQVIGDKWPCSIVGPEHAQVLIFLEQAAIETTVLEKGHMEGRGKLWGKN